MRKHSDLIAIVVVILISVLIVFVSPFIHKSGFVLNNTQRNLHYEEAVVKSIEVNRLQPEGKLENIEVGYQDITVEVTSGKFKGQNFKIRNSISRLYNYKVKKNTKVVVGMFMEGENIQDIGIYTYKRDTVIYGLVILLFLLVVIVGRIKGLKSVVSLIFTLITIVYLMLPLMFRGLSPIIAATGTSIVVTLVTLYLINGYSKKTLAAILGTTAGVVIAGFASFVAGELAHLSGLTLENAESIFYIAENSGLKVQGLMFASILIGSLGAVMDMGMSIASALYEVHRVNGKLTARELFKSGINIGQDMIGTMCNTLILAFVGGSLTVLLLLMSANMPSVQLLNLDVLGTELIQGLSGSIGIVLTVPITALAASVIYKRQKI